MYKPHFFFTKLKPKIEGVAYPWIHLCFEFSKTQLMFIKLLKVPRKKHKRNQERVAVVHCLFYSVVAPKGVFECLSANLALQRFLQAINFRFTQTTICLQLVTATRIFPPRAIKYHRVRKYSQGKWPTVSLFFTTFMANSLTELSGSCSA